MRTRSLKKYKVNVITLGCSKNMVDSEVLMRQLKANNFEVQHSDELSDSNILIVNTCGFIESAKQQSIETILNCVEAKKRRYVEKVYVTGCLSERYKEDLQKEIDGVDAWFGTKDLPRLLKTINADYKHELIGERLLTTPSHYAYLKISEGCNRPCSFCAIPLMRGKHVSVPIENIIKEATHLVCNGVKEIILIAQDLTYYGLDLYQKRKLAELLKKLSDIEGLHWIRLHYAYPSGFPMEILDVIQEQKNICKYLDIPLQHISNAMLQSMRRGITKEKIIELIDKIRERVPGIAIRTTLICGYPGETQKDHEEMLEWVEKTKFERLGVFTYSHEENTHAYLLNDEIPQAEKQRRAHAVMKLQRKISMAQNKRYIGKTLHVLFDKKEGDYLIGRTEFDSPDIDNTVIASVSSDYSFTENKKKNICAYVGNFAKVKIMQATEYDLFGEITHPC